MAERDDQPRDFSGPESDRVLTAMAVKLAGVLGRQAARELFKRDQQPKDDGNADSGTEALT